MVDALQVIRFSFRDFWDELVPMVLLDILWSVTAFLPFIPLLAFKTMSLGRLLAIDAVLLLPLPVISGGLAYVANQISRGKRIGWGVFVYGVRHYAAKSLVVALANLVALIVIVANLEFYAVFLQGPWTLVAAAVWLVLGLYWLLTQMFWFPMILELESEKVWVALRNALAMTIVTPLFTMACALGMAILVVVSVVLSVPAVLAMGGLLLLIANHATRSRLAFARKEPYQPGIYSEVQKRAR